MYKIVGGDQREYGPVTSDQVREWISTGRANAQSLASFEGSPWKPLSTFPEFADALRTAVPPALPPGTIPGAIPGQTAQAYMGGRNNNVAIAGLVCAVLGLCCSPLSLVGLILSIIGLLQIMKEPQTYSTSKVVPIIGIVLGLLAVVFNIIFFASGAFSEMMRNMPR
jgi:hypothetical protein